MGKRIHNLSQVDIVKKQAICAHCGLVPIKTSPSLKPRCMLAIRALRSKYGKTRYWRGITGIKGKTEACAICGSKVRLVLDHDHKSKQFRGWICSRCNLMLGLSQDNPKVLKSAIRYLKS